MGNFGTYIDMNKRDRIGDDIEIVLL